MTEPTRDRTGLDGRQAPLAERLLFENRVVVIVLFALLTLFFGYNASKLEPDASFEKMIPTSHPYIQNYLKNRADLKSLGNSIRIIVETTEGDIFDAEFQDTLQRINDEVFYITGVDRAGLKSIWRTSPIPTQRVMMLRSGWFLAFSGVSSPMSIRSFR